MLVCALALSCLVIYVCIFLSHVCVVYIYIYINCKNGEVMWKYSIFLGALAKKTWISMPIWVSMHAKRHVWVIIASTAVTLIHCLCTVWSKVLALWVEFILLYIYVSVFCVNRVSFYWVDT